MSHDVVVVGAGLAGLACAKHLAERGIKPLILEAADRPGGRVRTDEVEGFLLDRGFQVLLTSYPEARRVLDYDRLELRAFFHGALVRVAGRTHRIADPFRHPLAAVAGLLAPVGGLTDKLRVPAFRHRVRRASLEEIFSRPETTAHDAFKQAGFSDAMIRRFFSPFFGGTFLERALHTSSRVLEFHFKMFSEGDAALPRRGMQAMPEQLAEGLGSEQLRLGVRVERVERDRAVLADGEELRARAVVLATDASGSADLGTSFPRDRRFRGVTCLYFDAPEPPVDEPVLMLDGEGRGPVNNLAVPSAVHGEYAPAGRALVSASVVSPSSHDDPALPEAVKRQMKSWFGRVVDEWRHLRTYRIPEALPAQSPGFMDDRPRAPEGVFACGDYLDTSSIQGALVSGREAADRVAGSLAR